MPKSFVRGVLNSEPLLCTFEVVKNYRKYCNFGPQILYRRAEKIRTVIFNSLRVCGEKLVTEIIGRSYTKYVFFM